MTDPTDVTEPTTPVPPAPPAPSDHSRTARTVAAVVAVVALAGGVGALFGGGRSNEEPTRRTPTGALTTPPAAVEAPEEVELPGPKAPGITGSGPGKSVRPLVQAGPDMTIEPPTDLGDETTTTTEADSTSDDPGTSSDEPGTSDASGDVVAIPGDLSVTLAEGWGDASTGDGYTVVTTAGAALAIGAYDVTDQVTAADLLAEETRAQGDSVSDLHLTDIEDIPVNTVHVSGGAGRIYEGILVSQNGSVAVEGDLYAVVLDDGTGYTFTTTTQKGGYDEHGADFQAMISSVLASIGARP